MIWFAPASLAYEMLLASRPMFLVIIYYVKDGYKENIFHH